MSRIMLAGTNSGCGKTTVTCAILAALKNRGAGPTAFKCGPDYIDPMFHRAVAGVAAYNLDPFFLDGGGLRSHLAAHAGGISVIEGAMGFYDGIAATSEASAYSVALKTQTPVVLVVRAKGSGASLGALLEGFWRHEPDNRIMGVIFNEANEGRRADLAKIAGAAGVQMLGTMPCKPEWAMPSRHLGLLTVDEIAGLKGILAELGRQAEDSIDIDGLLALACRGGVLPPANGLRFSTGGKTPPLQVAIAKDEAFCFMYGENLELLRELGCEPVFFSPMRDKALPPDISGLYLGGGYPELYAEALAENGSMRESVKYAIDGGLPTVAEGGGFLYLHGCGVIEGKTRKTERLRRFGYITLTANRDNLLCKAGESIRAHEFHYCESESPGEAFTAKKAGRELSYSCIHATETLYAGFPQLYFPANPTFAQQFVERMTQHEAKRSAVPHSTRKPRGV
jgi:cobyrinic acid a,c-diamide synthase